MYCLHNSSLLHNEVRNICRKLSPLSGELARRLTLFVSVLSSNGLSSRKSLMVEEVEKTDSLPSLADGGGACVEATRFGLIIGNGVGHGE